MQTRFLARALDLPHSLDAAADERGRRTRWFEAANESSGSKETLA